MKAVQTLPIPSFFNPKFADEWNYRPDQYLIFQEAMKWKKSHDIKSGSTDSKKVHLLLIDTQKDFCFPGGTLFVGGRSGRGAMDDSARIAQFIYRNLPVITDITTTLDTHFAYQIFFPWFWVDSDGNPLEPHRMLNVEEVKSGAVKPNPAVASWLCNGNYGWLCKQVLFYCEELARGGKYLLYLWPPHCLLGSDGHALVGVIHEARMFHAFSRGMQSNCETKGGHPLTENYSVLRPEVVMRYDGLPLTEQPKNIKFIEKLLYADAVVIGGQASSHCVKSSIDDFLGEILAKDPVLARKVYVLRDCMSAVVVPGGMDFTKDAEAALAKFADHGMHVVNSTDPIDSWLKI